jgi:Xaa-Pro aminopeptidase
MKRVSIPVSEYKERVARAAAKAAARNLDLMVVTGTESDYANTRYFSGFWPLFERCGVAVSAKGDAALMTGPESAIFASDVSWMDKIFTLTEFRESADPAYPELRPQTFKEVFKSIGVSGERIRIGLGSYMDCPLVVYEGLKAAFPNAEIVRCDDITVALRSIKSENEIACIKEGTRITKIATEEVIKRLRPGVTELEMVGVAQKTIYEHGAEYEGLPMYVFSEKSTRHAISRPGYRTIEKGDIVQLNLSAKVDGYSPSIGMPVSVGRISAEKKKYADFCLQAHTWTQKRLKAGIKASDVAKAFYAMYRDNGMSSNYLYGPCHGTGIIEVEAPWMETTSDYILQPNMTFQIDTFVTTPEFGIRWEKGVVIRENGCESVMDGDFTGVREIE